MTLLRLFALIAAFLAFWISPSSSASAQEPTPCYTAEATFSYAASVNALSLHNLDWEPFGREHGWETYLPMMQQEIGTTCSADTPDFASALAVFQARYGLMGDGVFSAETFNVLKGVWQERRPFVMARVRGECPHNAERPELEEFDYTEETAWRPGRMAHGPALAAYRRMVADARAAVPEIAADRDLLTVFSAFRHPDIDGVRCEDEGNCNGLARAACSAHRTGWAIDIMVGRAEGYGVASTDPYNRLVQSRGLTYRWLVANAARYGFVNYIYEPWHWEYVGPEADYSP